MCDQKGATCAAENLNIQATPFFAVTHGQTLPLTHPPNNTISVVFSPSHRGSPPFDYHGMSGGPLATAAAAAACCRRRLLPPPAVGVELRALFSSPSRPLMIAAARSAFRFPFDACVSFFFTMVRAPRARCVEAFSSQFLLRRSSRLRC